MRDRYIRVGLNVLQERKYLRLCEITYTAEKNGTPEGAREVGDISASKWELVQRTTRQVPLDRYQRTPAPLAVDSTEICAFLSRGNESFLILVAQYRPPLDAVVIEFPAGLIDPGEDAKMAALRELKEETGYSACVEDVFDVSDPVCLEPGLSDSCCQFVKIRVDGDSEMNCKPQPQLDDGEDIDVILLPLKLGKNVESDVTPTKMLKRLVAQKEEMNNRTIVDARLYMFLEGLSFFKHTSLKIATL
ncbi:NUDIX hydrolase, conserved, putative [Trypanosoma brucei gambiense DAL972]|uniref:NUDIX hydrolase, conserved, putative n=2 Tax=Trypanosoma brucei TaxID=5691 RepID=D0A8I0_TRYB9|nr:NUDIX hydrolase, conserved, putative [Trypanosoma brucei gambiense DAL972]RHW68346.1 NUDIX hydrolase 3 [Trypanosoma brucei equiperdum]CBH17981.1 NUDIX hydrolase, conserved, putative [Trypanosoma brucei gambiense DAL972]|eukprot:XP_011780245.1 NUDIX hydrolase, conserved, putative [Trypanosoma brucei gambiense DAL972]